jgi:hypothetical protein
VRSVGLEDMVDQICSRPVDELEHHILRLRHELVTVRAFFRVLALKLLLTCRW